MGEIRAMTISTFDVATLEDCFRSGASGVAAAEVIDCSEPTAYRYFRAFKFAGVPCRKIVGQGARVRKMHFDPPLPRYVGPAWIGKAITAPTPPIGSAWIGKRVNI